MANKFPLLGVLIMFNDSITPSFKYFLGLSGASDATVDFALCGAAMKAATEQWRAIARFCRMAANKI